jgi:hypothetical protein
MGRDRPLICRLHDIELWRRARLDQLYKRRAPSEQIGKATERFVEVATRGNSIALSHVSTFSS